MLRFVGLIALAALVGGCAFNPQSANLVPRASVTSSSEGRSVLVGVRVVDDRPSKSLGRRGAGLYGAAAEITSTQDLAVVVDEQVKEALRKKGFRPTDVSQKSEAQLTVELRLLEYSTSVGFFTGGVNVKGNIKAVGKRAQETYERTYRVDKEERVVIVPTAEANEELINKALTELLSQMFDDVGLFRFLVTPPVAVAPGGTGGSN